MKKELCEGKKTEKIGDINYLWRPPTKKKNIGNVEKRQWKEES